jgi:UPF0755 protein
VTRRRRPRLRLGGRGVLVLLGLAVLAVAAAFWSYSGPGPASKTTTVILERGSGVRQIAGALQDAGAISSAGLFTVMAQLTGATSELKAGEYEIAPRASMAAVLADIRAGKVVRHLVTIPEGWTSGMALEAVMASPVLTGTAVEPPEGSLLPDTYQVQRGDARGEVLQRMMSARDKLLAELWAKRQPDLPLASPEEAVTLASIVEKETGVPAERPRVAAVFVNRLRAGMALQSDPTIIYGISKGRPLGRGILASELAAATPYNTYVVVGLPPTPIANPGRESLAAVMNPPKTEELYFVADGTGGHVFAKTYEEHEKNVAKWRKLERERAAAAAAGGAAK